MQNGVFSLKRPVYRKNALIENVRKTIRFAREHGIPVVFSLHENDTFLRAGTAGHRLIVAGVISNGYVRRACQSALEKGYSVTLVKDAHSTFYGNAEKAVGRVNREMESAGARVVPAEEL